MPDFTATAPRINKRLRDSLDGLVQSMLMGWEVLVALTGRPADGQKESSGIVSQPQQHSLVCLVHNSTGLPSAEQQYSILRV